MEENHMALSLFKSRSKQLSKKAIISLKHKINANPEFKEHILLLFKPFPKLKERLKGIRTHRHAYMSMCEIEKPEQLPLRARQLYDELKESIENRNGTK